jgi:basic membrane protein A and related proteins
VLTSALKKVDEAVFQTIEKVVNGETVGGGTTVFGLAEDGVGLGKTSPNVDAALVEQTEAQAQKIIDGEITIPETVK